MDLIKKFRKLEDWDSEDELGPTLTATGKFSDQANKSARVVVLKHMFTLGELEEDPSLLLDLKEDVREECATLGDVTTVVLYDVREFVVSYFDLSLIVGIPTARARGYHDGQVPRPNQRESVHNRKASPFHPFVSYSRSKRF